MANEGQNGNKLKRKRRFLLQNCAGRVVEEKNHISKERICNFSLDFPAFRPSVRVGPRRKVVLRGMGYAWALLLGSFDNSKR